MFLFIVLVIGILDLTLSREISLGPVFLLYVVAKAQADMAANRFLREGLKKPDPQEIPPEGFHWEAPKWASEMKEESYQPPRSEPKIQARIQEPKKKAEQAKPERPLFRSPQKSPFRLPNFKGRPHEILGISENAATRTIVSAFRHWIKKHHPDHMRSNLDLATERARKLNTAKESLLERRKQKRAA